MLGSMQDWPLLTWRLLGHAAINHPRREIVSLTVEGDEVRSDWQAVAARSRRCAQALAGLGMRRGDRIATLAWNTHRHIECWYGISGMGGVAHTINPRLFDDQIVYIANHAEDRALLFDACFLPLVERLRERLRTIEHYVVLAPRAHMPESELDLVCYEDLIAAQDGDFAWAEVEETAPSGLCYTSGTTGNPKGVLYSHRSNVLHAFAAAQGDVLGLTSRSVILPVVPMYHANAWGVPYAAAMAGAKVVLAGPHFDAPTLHALIVREGVTVTAAVPTVWLGMLQHLEASGAGLGALQRVMIGGAAAPRSMIEAFERDYGVTVAHAWGMTEMSPIGSVGILCAGGEALPPAERLDLKSKQGRALFGVEMKVQDDAGNELPRDGRSFGHLMVRGPWIVERYFRGDGGEVLDAEGWFDTGDIATIDPQGYMQITDRSKDVIKSGGEWISSIALENAAVGHPAVAEAAVIGLPHPKWDERPLLVLVLKAGASVSKDEMIDYLSARVAKWWLPDDVVVVDELPHTATGKLLKTALREQFHGHTLPTAA